MREMKPIVLFLALAVVATMAMPALGVNSPKVTINQTEGGGFINSTVMDNKSIFGFEAINNKAMVRGNLHYIDRGAHIKLHGNVTVLIINKTAMTATLSGVANVTNATGANMVVPYTVNVNAGGKGKGIFNITIPVIPGFLPSGYSDNDTLLGGYIVLGSRVLHPPPPKPHILAATYGAGSINSTGFNKSTFSFVAINETIWVEGHWKDIVRGNFKYIDHGADIKLHGNVTTLRVNKTENTATFKGMANVTNSTGANMIVPYTIDVNAGGKGKGIFSITIPAVPGFLPSGYSDNGTLLGGRIALGISPSPKPHIAGKGFINSTIMPNTSVFDFLAENNSGKVHGNLVYDDLGYHIKLHGNVTKLWINKTSKIATFKGMATVTDFYGAKRPVSYTIHVKAGQKGTGFFNITIPAVSGFLPSGYTDKGKLHGGYITVDP